jgi:hypothetical protein
MRRRQVLVFVWGLGILSKALRKVRDSPNYAFG